MDNEKIIGLKIKELRGKKSIDLGCKYTGEMLAKDLGISRSYLGDIESGRRKPTDEIISKMIELFSLPLNYFSSNENSNNSINSYEEIDEETRAIARDMQKLSSSNKDLLKQLIKSMTDAGDKELNK